MESNILKNSIFLLSKKGCKISILQPKTSILDIFYHTTKSEWIFFSFMSYYKSV